MKKLRVNLCFNETDNLEVIRLIEQKGIKRPSGLIHDLIRKGLLFDKLLSGDFASSLSRLTSEDRGNTAPPSEKRITSPEPATRNVQQGAVFVTQTGESAQNGAGEEQGNVLEDRATNLAALGMSFD
jgi:hypothetical protein